MTKTTIGYKLEELKVGEVYEEVVSQRLVVVVSIGTKMEWDTGCKGLVYNSVLGLTQTVSIQDFQLKCISRRNEQTLFLGE